MPKFVMKISSCTTWFTTDMVNIKRYSLMEFFILNTEYETVKEFIK